jgi:hypothetical protein
METPDPENEPDSFEREVALVRQNPELMEFLAERSKPGPRLTLDEVRESLDLSEPRPDGDSDPGSEALRP